MLSRMLSLSSFERAVVAVALLVLPACRTTNIDAAYQQHAQGDFDGAVVSIQESIQNQSGFKTEDTVWLLLEQGKMLQDAGRFAESNASLEKVRTILDNKGDSAFISVNSIGNDIGAMQTDDRQMDYIGTLYDRILLHTAMAINFAMLGDLESAAANVRAQIKRQQEAVELNQKRLAEIDRRRGEDQGRQSGMSGDSFFSSFTDFEASSGMGEEMKRMMGLAGHDGYADYHAPYGYTVGAILLAAAGRDGEAAQIAQMAADPKLRVAFQGATTPIGPSSDEVIVVFENGLAPARIDASFPYLGPNGPTKVPVPKIALRRDGRGLRLRVDTGESTYETESVDSVDGIVVTDFRNALPIIWFRAMMQVMLKEVETYIGRQAARNSQSDRQSADLAELGVLMGGMIARNVVAPDLRTWQSLPGEHQMARLPRPASNSLSITVLGQGGQPWASTAVELPNIPGPVLVFVRSTGWTNVRAYAAPLVHGAPRP